MQRDCLLPTAILVLGLGVSLYADDKESVEPLQVGDKAPDFEIETFDGKTIKLSDRFASGKKSGRPVVLLFSRAHW